MDGGGTEGEGADCCKQAHCGPGQAFRQQVAVAGEMMSSGPRLGVGLRVTRRLAPRAPTPDVADGLRCHAEFEGDGLAANHSSTAALLETHLVWSTAVDVDGLLSA
jgi:hypothetical protein